MAVHGYSSQFVPSARNTDNEIGCSRYSVGKFRSDEASDQSVKAWLFVSPVQRSKDTDTIPESSSTYSKRLLDELEKQVGYFLKICIRVP